MPVMVPICYTHFTRNILSLYHPLNIVAGAYWMKSKKKKKDFIDTLILNKLSAGQ